MTELMETGNHMVLVKEQQATPAELRAALAELDAKELALVKAGIALEALILEGDRFSLDIGRLKLSAAYLDRELADVDREKDVLTKELD